MRLVTRHDLDELSRGLIPAQGADLRIGEIVATLERNA